MNLRSVLAIACGVIITFATDVRGTGFSKPLGREAPDLFRWTDTCNVYVVRNGDAAVLIDLGDGSVLDHLHEIGVTRVDWVLFTHHHREQCQGAPKLGKWRERGTQVAAPEAERAFFERPQDFRKINVSLSDAFTIHGTSYVRPPIQPIPLDRGFKTNDTFAWRGREFVCLDTRGNSPGAMTYLLREDGRTLAFSGDVMLDGAKMHTWFDTEWDYGFAAGIKALRASVFRLGVMDLTRLLPSHGPVVREPGKQLSAYDAKLGQLEKLYVRGYGVGRVSGQSFDAHRRLERVAGFAAPVQVQAPELLAELLADSFGQRSRAALRLRPAG